MTHEEYTHIPGSKDELNEVMVSFVPPGLKVVDIGPGAGKYSKLLREKSALIDAVEVWEPYVDRFDLRDLYDTVFIGNACDMPAEFWAKYDIAILGDVLEHMSIRDAKALLGRIPNALVCVPWLYKQDAIEGNEHEAHLQDDLTAHAMEMRYPNLRPRHIARLQGIYQTKGQQ